MDIADKDRLIPKAHIEVKPDDVKKIKGLPPGSRVSITLRGVVTAQFLRKLDSDKNLSSGDLTVEIREFSIRASEDNDLYKLFEDEEAA